jgi:hypothetical protein
MTGVRVDIYPEWNTETIVYRSWYKCAKKSQGLKVKMKTNVTVITWTRGWQVPSKERLHQFNPSKYVFIPLFSMDRNRHDLEVRMKRW